MVGCAIRAVGMANIHPFLLRKEIGFISRYLGNSHLPWQTSHRQAEKELNIVLSVLLSSDLIQHSLLLP